MIRAGGNSDRAESGLVLLPASDVKSLVWCGESLVDWVSGGIVYGLDRTQTDPRVNFAYKFDAAVATSDGEWAVIYERLGTKALLLRDGELVRELDRSFYCAESYEYPICLWRRGKRALIAHCPEEYNRLEIEDAETGERLTGGERSPGDLFHSRLQMNGAGSHLLSAGWVWHPWDTVALFDVDAALLDGRTLDCPEGSTPETLHLGLTQEGTACWQSNTRILLGGSDDDEAEIAEASKEKTEPRLENRGVAIYDRGLERCVSAFKLGAAPGTMMPLGETHVVTFYGHPRLVCLESGTVIAEWPTLATGRQTSSIILGPELPPSLALDPDGRRFAVATDDGIAVVTLAPEN